MVTYYSQAGEDQYLIDHHLKDVAPGERVYIEAGAMDGVRYSNTRAL